MNRATPIQKSAKRRPAAKAKPAADAQKSAKRISGRKEKQTCATRNDCEALVHRRRTPRGAWGLAVRIAWAATTRVPKPRHTRGGARTAARRGRGSAGRGSRRL